MGPLDGADVIVLPTLPDDGGANDERGILEMLDTVVGGGRTLLMTELIIEIIHCTIVPVGDHGEDVTPASKPDVAEVTVSEVGCWSMNCLYT